MNASGVELLARAARVLTPNYRPAPFAPVRGDGMYLYDAEGKRYLDFAGGIAVTCLGHAHPRLAQAIAEQAQSVLHISNLYLNEPAVALAEALVARSFADRVFFANSGTEANEAALKLARRYMRLVRGVDRFKFICADHSFHGRTWASITATGQPKYHEGFGPLVPGFVHVPYNDLAALESAIDEETCAIFVEPIQGESGVMVPEPSYLQGIRTLCDRHGLLMILDEVQTGFGRTGTWFAYEQAGVKPDIISLAKGLGGGVPIGAMLCTEEVSKGFAPGAHASTFGGNPLACRAGLTVLQVIEDEQLLENVRTVGAYLNAKLADLATRGVPGAIGARGVGLLQALVVAPTVDRAALRTAALERGLLVTQAGDDTLRLVPPYIVGTSHVDEAIEILEACLRSLA